MPETDEQKSDLIGHEHVLYDPTSNPETKNVLDQLHNVIQTNDGYSDLYVHSLRKDYSLELLIQFYNEQMIPHFPLEDERDSLEDWIYCLDPEQVALYDDEAKQGPVMDILLLVCSSENEGVKSKQPIILAGIAFEYYQKAECGLVSYVTVNTSFRRKGVMKRLHPLAIRALKNLHKHCYYTRNGCIPDYEIRAVFAETNTVDAGDASKEEIASRHQALFCLGYRLINFPYVQPPLGIDQDSFDDVMLLVYQGIDKNDSWFATESIPTSFPYDYVIDFYQSVFGYSEVQDDRQENEEHIKSFEDHWYYNLSTWYIECNPYCKIQTDLPWHDVTNKHRNDYEEIRERGERQRVVAVVGAGAAGLSAAIELAKNAKSPLLVRLFEANKFVGGRIRTVITDGDNFADQYVDQTLTERCKKFAPWSVPIGAEFVHGVDSVVNDMIEDNGWVAEETFDFCTVDEYPSANSFTLRARTSSLSHEQRKSSVKIFGDGKSWNVRGSTKNGCSRYENSITTAQRVWEGVYSVGEDVMEGEQVDIPIDMSLSSFTEHVLEGRPNNDMILVQDILDAIYAKTAGTSTSAYGVNEGAREELSWDYTESNYRTEECFAEFIEYFLKEIDSIATKKEAGESHGIVELIPSSPIVKIGKSNKREGITPKVMLTTRDGRKYVCDKVIVAVPLAVLKVGKIQFCDSYTLPVEKKEAIKKINMFSGMKGHMLLRYGTDIHPSHVLNETELFFCPGEIFAQIWLRSNEDTVFLTGFVVADGRDRILLEIKQGRSAEEILLNQLHRMFEKEGLFLHQPATCSAFELHDWSKDEFIMGLYSSPSVGAGWKISGNGLKTARHDMKASVKETIYFAGEHANIKTCATVQAAMESGLIAAAELLESFEKT